MVICPTIILPNMAAPSRYNVTKDTGGKIGYNLSSLSIEYELDSSNINIFPGRPLMAIIVYPREMTMKTRLLDAAACLNLY